MTKKQVARIAALEKAGWTLTVGREEQRVAIPGTKTTRQVPGSYTFERIWRGRAVHEVGETLDRAIACAEWQERRITAVNAETPNQSVVN